MSHLREHYSGYTKLKQSNTKTNHSKEKIITCVSHLQFVDIFLGMNKNLVVYNAVVIFVVVIT